MIDFLHTGKQVLCSELSTLIEEPNGSVQTLQIALSTVYMLDRALGDETPISISSLLTNALIMHTQVLKDILETPGPSCPCLRPSLTRCLMFLRLCWPLLFDAIPDGNQGLRPARIFLRVEMDWRALITNAFLLREESEVVNSNIPEDREGMGIYSIPKEDCPDKESFFGNAIFSHFYSILNLLYRCRIWRENDSEEIAPANLILSKLREFPVDTSLHLGEQVRLSRQMEYTVCNVVLFPSSLFPSSLETMKEQLHNRAYNFPCYIFIGESQCGVVEVHRGDLSTGYIRYITKWVDILGVEVPEANKRCLIMTVRSKTNLELCVNQQIAQSLLDKSIDKRYCVQSVLCLRFVSAPLCQKIYNKILNKRNAYFETTRKKLVSLIDGCM